MKKAINTLIFNLLVLAAGIGFSTTASAQGSAGTNAAYETTKIVSMPTAGIVAKGMYSVDANVFDPGGALVDFNAGILHNFSIGVSFSGSGIIGSTAMKFQEMPGFSL